MLLILFVCLFLSFHNVCNASNQVLISWWTCHYIISLNNTGREKMKISLNLPPHLYYLQQMHQAFWILNKHKLTTLNGIDTIQWIFLPDGKILGKLWRLLGEEIKNDFHGCCCFSFRNFLNLENFRENNNENDNISHQHHALWFSSWMHIVFVLYHWVK